MLRSHPGSAALRYRTALQQLQRIASLPCSVASLMLWPLAPCSAIGESPKYRCILEGGIDISKYSSDLTLIGYERRAISQLCFGAGFRMQFGKHWDFETAISYSARGELIEGTYMNDGILTQQRIRTKLAYLTLPFVVMLKTEESDITPYVRAGLGMALRVGGDIERLSGDQHEDPDAYFEGSDLGATVGAGVRARGLPVPVYVSVEYFHGLVDIRKGEHEIRNRSVSLRLGLELPLGERSASEAVTK